jgi:hypothetical protein
MAKDSKKMEKDKLITKAFCISEANVGTIKDLGKAKGLNDSAALRVIINEWFEYQTQKVRIPIMGHIDKDGVVTLDKLSGQK